jgi:putative serine protease PepD
VTGDNHGSAWWSDALNDPWRDPTTPAQLVTQSPVPPPPQAPTAPPPVRGTRLSMVILVAAISALFAGTLGGALGFAAASRSTGSGHTTLGRATAPAPAAAQRSPDSLAGVVSRVMPSVVTVHAEAGTGENLGSGFIISADGYVLTNDHVIAESASDGIKVTFADDRTSSARIAGRDAESDLAVLKVDRSDLAPVELGDSDSVAVGDPVLAIGSPLALTGTVTYGIVSALDRTMEGGDGNGTTRYYAAIQTDAAVNHGNSGGPLFDTAGRVIGINSMIKSVSSASDESGNIGLAFAIPINQASRIAGELIDFGKARRTVIGANLQTSYRGTGGGVRLADVESGGPAAGAGLRSGDVITKLGTHPIESPTDLIALVRRYDPGTVISVTYRRDGATATAQVTLVADAK